MIGLPPPPPQSSFGVTGNFASASSSWSCKSANSVVSSFQCRRVVLICQAGPKPPLWVSTSNILLTMVLGSSVSCVTWPSGSTTSIQICPSLKPILGIRYGLSATSLAVPGVLSLISLTMPSSISCTFSADARAGSPPPDCSKSVCVLTVPSAFQAKLITPTGGGGSSSAKKLSNSPPINPPTIEPNGPQMLPIMEPKLWKGWSSKLFNDSKIDTNGIGVPVTPKAALSAPLTASLTKGKLNPVVTMLEASPFTSALANAK